MDYKVLTYRQLDELFKCVTVARARIENGAPIEQAFEWLLIELNQVLEGEILYGED